jgi:hypothetical protein
VRNTRTARSCVRPASTAHPVMRTPIVSHAYATPRGRTTVHRGRNIVIVQAIRNANSHLA